MLNAMWCRTVYVIFIVTFTTCCCSDLDEQQHSEDVKVVDTEKWRAVENHPHLPTDWVPAEGPAASVSQPSADEQPVIKRRRVRKRKRRPQNFERDYHEDNTYSERFSSRPRLRRPRPEHLDQQRNQWGEEMLSEEPFRPIRGYKRRRLYPKYEETSQQSEENVEDIVIATSQIVVSEEATQQKVPSINQESKTRITVSEKYQDPYVALGEDNRKINSSKKRVPESVIDQEEISDEPYSERVKPTEVSSTRAPIDLKAILKQAGGISLSELLQRQNLSLSDLLNGEEHAIAALTKMHEEVTEKQTQTKKIVQTNSNDELKPYLPRRNTSVLNQKHPEHSIMDNKLSPVRETGENEKNVNPTHVQKENNLRFDHKINQLKTETTTERRIFVPSHPKYYTSINFKPNIKDLNIQVGSTTAAEAANIEENSVETTATQSTVYTTESIKKPEQNKTIHKNNLPQTLAKLRNYTRTTTKPIIKPTNTIIVPTVAPPPVNAIKININELFGISKVLNTAKTTEGPLKISVDIQQMKDTSKEEDSNENITITEHKSEIIFNDINSTEDFKESEKVKSTSAKQEIQEILSDKISRENLMNVLRARNMTLTELLEQRERGSSQRHLADIFHNQTREPEPPEDLTIDHIIKSKTIKKPFSDRSFDSLPLFLVNKETETPDNKNLDFLISMDETLNARESRQHQHVRKQADDYSIINNPLFRTDAKKANEVLNRLIPVWREAYTNMQRNQDINHNLLHDSLILKDQAQHVEDIENQIAEAVNGALSEVDSLSHNLNEDEENYVQLPYGVRSAVIASATIVGISLLVFVTIFVLFKLSHKKNKHLSYSNSLSSLKIRSPILETEYQKRIFGNIMNSTLGRSKKISTISSCDPHSLQDYLWENERKPFQ